MRRAPPIALLLVAAAVHCAHERPASEVPSTQVAAPPADSSTAAPPTCHWNAFQSAPTTAELDDALAKLSALEATVKLTFDASAKKPVIQGPMDDVFGPKDPPTGAARSGTWPKLLDEARARDAELRAIRPTALVSARSLLDVGAIYDALAASMMAWDPVGMALLTPVQQTVFQRTATDPAVAATLLEGIKRSVVERQHVESRVVKSNAYIAYLGVLHLVSMCATSEDANAYRSRATLRVHALSEDADVRNATTSLLDPTSTESDCPLLLGPPERYR